MVLATDLFHMMDDPGGPSHVNFDEPVATFDARYVLAGGGSNWSVAGNILQPLVDGDGVLIDVPTADREALVLQTTDDNATNNLSEWKDSSGNVLGGIQARGTIFSDLNTAVSNLFLGTGAGLGTNSGDDNVFIGWKAGGKITSAAENVVIGSDAGTELTSGVQNVFIGNRCGRDVDTGNSNVFIGYRIGQNATTGGQNTCVGAGAGNSLTGASNVVFYGSNAGKENTTGTQNTNVGKAAGQNCVTGHWNTNIGYFAAISSLGSGNTNVGTEAGRYGSANRNVNVGYRAGKGTDGDVYNNSICIGKEAGLLLTTGSNNLLIGYQAGNVITTGASNIIIGYDIDPSAAGASNELTIGDLIKGYLAAHGSGPAINLLGGTPQAQQAHIVDADGTLADITTKFNTLLADLEGFGLLAAV